MPLETAGPFCFLTRAQVRLRLAVLAETRRQQPAQLPVPPVDCLGGQAGLLPQLINAHRRFAKEILHFILLRQHNVVRACRPVDDHEILELAAGINKKESRGEVAEKSCGTRPPAPAQGPHK